MKTTGHLIPRRLIFLSPVLLLAIGFLPVKAHSTEAKLIIAAGGIGGSYYAGGAVIGEAFETKIPGVKVTVVPGGNFANPTRLDRGEAEIGFSAMSMAIDAMKGREPYKHEHKNVRALVNFSGTQPEFYQFALLKGTKITSFRELAAKKFPLGLTAGTRGSGSELTTRRVLGEYGITYDTIRSWGGKVQHTGWTEATSLISDGHAHAVATQGPFGLAWLNELFSAREMVFLPVDDDVRKVIVEKYGMGIGELPAKSYRGQDAAVPTVTDYGVLLCRGDLPDELVYNLTREIVEVRARLKQTVPSTFGGFGPETAWKDTGFPLHPGAKKYFQEKGYMK